MLQGYHKELPSVLADVLNVIGECTRLFIAFFRLKPWLSHVDVILKHADTETQCQWEATEAEVDKQIREKFQSFLQLCVVSLRVDCKCVCVVSVVDMIVVLLQSIVSEPLLKERIDYDTLENVGILASKSQFSQKYVKTKTRL